MMPVGWGWWFTDAERERFQTPPKVGKPRRDRAKNKAQRRARKHAR